MSLTDYPKVRILVLGDSGVGKTSLVHYLCNGEALKNPNWTTGLSASVKVCVICKISHVDPKPCVLQLHEDHFVEFWDVSGQKAYESSRKIFYSDIDGVMLVHSMGNIKSYYNLKKWVSGCYSRHTYPLTSLPVQISEIAASNSAPALGNTREIHVLSQPYRRQRASSTTRDIARSTSNGGSSLSNPVLVVGNKSDEANHGKNKKQRDNMQDLGVAVDTIETNALSGNVDLAAFDTFFSSVIASASSHKNTLGEHINPALQSHTENFEGGLGVMSGTSLPRPGGESYEKWK
jgi:GTPase SAR1 family protein